MSAQQTAADGVPADGAPAGGALDVVASPATADRWGRAGDFIGDALRLAGVVVAEVVSRRPVRPLADEAVMSRTAGDTFVVRMVEPERAVVIGDAAGGMSWACVLEPVDEHTTRLITRVHATYDSLALEVFFGVFWHPAHFAMQRKQLLNLKRLVEATR